MSSTTSSVALVNVCACLPVDAALADSLVVALTALVSSSVFCLDALTKSSCIAPFIPMRCTPIDNVVFNAMNNSASPAPDSGSPYTKPAPPAAPSAIAAAVDRRSVACADIPTARATRIAATGAPKPDAKSGNNVVIN